MQQVDNVDIIMLNEKCPGLARWLTPIIPPQVKKKKEKCPKRTHSVWFYLYKTIQRKINCDRS